MADTDFSVLPGGYIKDGKAFYSGFSQDLDGGKHVRFGMEGVVCSAVDDLLSVRFADVILKCRIEDLSMSPPSAVFAGGYQLDDTVYFAGSSQDLNGDALEPGCPGTVVGGSSDNVAVRFTGIKTVIRCQLEQINKSWSTLQFAGGFFANDQVFFVGASQTLDGGDKLEYGAQGMVVGGGGEQLAVKFSGIKANVNIALASLSMSQPSKELPGGFQVDDTVYYAGCNQFLDNGFSFGDQLVYGSEAKVTGPAGDDKICLRVEGNTMDVNCLIKDIARERPPTELAGGYRVNDEVYLIGSDSELSNGDKLVKGTCGSVVGPADQDRVYVLFSGTSAMIKVKTASLSGSKP